MAEGPALEKRYSVRNGIVGSNPTLSARLPLNNLSTFHGEMSELAEGARLEIVCAAKSGTEGSNPSLSAIIFTGFQYVLFSSGTQIPSTNI